MNYSLTRPTTPPSRGHQTDAGVDVYIPSFSRAYIEAFDNANIGSQRSYYFDTNRNELVIYPHERVKVPTGVYFNVPAGNMLLVLEKTSVPNKTGIISGARVVDQGYQGEFIASLVNTADVEARLAQDQKFIQVVITPINQDRSLCEVPYEELYLSETSRGTGAYGSTGIQ